MIKNSAFLIAFLFFSCQTESEQEVEDPYPVEEGQSLKYNNEYLKIVDDADEENKPKRLINEDAVLNLGQVKLTWGEDTKKADAFRKGGTDLHFSKKGVRMRVRDMYDMNFSILILHEKDPFKVAGNSFSIGEGLNNRTQISFTDNWEIGPLDLQWNEGEMKVEQLKASTGEVVLHFSGKATNRENNETRPFKMDVNMRFEEITSSVRPKEVEVRR